MVIPLLIGQEIDIADPPLIAHLQCQIRLMDAQLPFRFKITAGIVCTSRQKSIQRVHFWM